MENKQDIPAYNYPDVVYRSIVEHSIAAIFLGSPDSGEIYFANPAATEVFGYTEEEFRAINRKNLFEPNDDLVAALKERKETGKFNGILTCIRKNGESFPCEITSVIFTDTDGSLKTATTLIDISDSHAAEKQLLQINERYALATSATFDAIWDADLVEKTIHWGEGFERLFGYKLGDRPTSENIWENNIHPDDKERVINNHLQIVFKNLDQTFWEDEYRFLRKDRSIAYVVDRCLIIRDKNGTALRVVGAMHDITDLKLKEQELLNNEMLKQKAISRAVIDTQENERTEIGKELHDHINQVLTTTKLYLDLAVADPEKNKQYIIKSSKNILQVIDEIRKISGTLMLPSITDLGLESSIAELSESISLTQKVRAGFSFDPDIENSTTKYQKLIIYRIIQEGLNNCLKHSEASEVYIDLKLDNELLKIKLKDDGKGFDPSTIRKGSGLNNIKNRVYLLNGQFDIATAPGKGCELFISIPVNEIIPG